MVGSYNQVFGGTAVRPSQPSYLALSLTSDTALVWPLETTEGNPYVAAAIDVMPSGAGLTLAMPPGNTGSTGVATMMTNVGAASFTLTDTSGNALGVFATTQSWLVVLTDNTTTNGTWRLYQLASTTSSATAASLAGAGLEANGPLLQTNLVLVPLSVNTTIVAANRAQVLFWDALTGGTLTFDLAANLGDGWYCYISNSPGAGPLIVECLGGAKIDGLSVAVLQPGQGGIFQCDGTNFITVGINIDPVPVNQGGTGSTTAPGALTNLGATTIGASIFTAPSAASVLALIGAGFTELTAGTNQNVSVGSGSTLYVCTAAIALYLPLSTLVSKQFVIGVYAQGGAVTITPNMADSINGNTAGAAFTVAEGESLLLATDANGNWWPFFGGGAVPINTQVFATAGTFTYTPTPGTLFVRVRGCGGGGQGGCTPVITSAPGTASLATGGDAGAYAEGWFFSAFAGITITVGAGGSTATAGANPGQAGGVSSFGALMSMPGGAGGDAGPTGSATTYSPAILARTITTSQATGGYLNLKTQSGGNATILAFSVGSGAYSLASGAGGASYFGAGGASALSAGSAGIHGNNAVNLGAGGSGAISTDDTTGRIGGAGGVGVVIVEEWGV